MKQTAFQSLHNTSQDIKAKFEEKKKFEPLQCALGYKNIFTRFPPGTTTHIIPMSHLYQVELLKVLFQVPWLPSIKEIYIIMFKLLDYSSKITQ